MDRIVLIGGVPRSGTNLTRRIIGSHSEIAVPPAEFQFFRQYSNGATVAEILANERLTDWNVDFSDLPEKSPDEVYATVLTRYARHLGKSIPGEKSPLNEFYLELIERWLVGFNLKFVHLVRNPIDVIASHKNMRGGGKSSRHNETDVAVLARNWCRSVAMGLAKSRSEPEHFFLLCYERLVADPPAVARQLCDFIGVAFEPERMLSLKDYAEHQDNTSFKNEPRESAEHGKIFKPGSRKSHLDDSELTIVRETCGELAWALGYQDEGFRCMPPEKNMPSGSGIKSMIRRLKARAPH